MPPFMHKRGRDQEGSGGGSRARCPLRPERGRGREGEGVPLRAALHSPFVHDAGCGAQGERAPPRDRTRPIAAQPPPPSLSRSCLCLARRQSVVAGGRAVPRYISHAAAHPCALSASKRGGGASLTRVSGKEGEGGCGADRRTPFLA